MSRGHAVTAVDNSAEMLSHVPSEARKVESNIEDLHLGRQFDVVLLASCLINTPDDSLRAAQLRACRKHVSARGCLICERFDPKWLRGVEMGPGAPLGDIAFSVERVLREGNLVELSLRYSTKEEDWRQHFTARILDETDVLQAVSEADFSTLEWINRRWAAARP